MAKKQIDKEIKDLKDMIKKKKAVIGKDMTIKLLRNGDISKVFVSSNCPDDVKKDLDYYCTLSKFEIVHLKQNNEELGTICKKPFNISIIGLAKGES